MCFGDAQKLSSDSLGRDAVIASVHLLDYVRMSLHESVDQSGAARFIQPARSRHCMYVVCVCVCAIT